MIDAVMRTDEPDEAMIQRLDREGRGAAAERKPIEARALTRLKAIVKDFRTLVLRLKRAAGLLHEQRGSNAQSIEATRRKGRDLNRRFKAASEGFEGLGKGQPDVDDISAACAAVAAKLLRDHAQAFETGSASNPFRQAIESDRFRLPAVARRPELTPESTWDALRDLAIKPAMNWLEAFDLALKRREHLATESLLAPAIPLGGSRLLRQHPFWTPGRLNDLVTTFCTYPEPSRSSLD